MTFSILTSSLSQRYIHTRASCLTFALRAYILCVCMCLCVNFYCLPVVYGGSSIFTALKIFAGDTCEKIPKLERKHCTFYDWPTTGMFYFYVVFSKNILRDNYYIQGINDRISYTYNITASRKYFVLSSVKQYISACTTTNATCVSVCV